MRDGNFLPIYQRPTSSQSYTVTSVGQECFCPSREEKLIISVIHVLLTCWFLMHTSCSWLFMVWKWKNRGKEIICRSKGGTKPHATHCNKGKYIRHLDPQLATNHFVLHELFRRHFDLIFFFKLNLNYFIKFGDTIKIA